MKKIRFGVVGCGAIHEQHCRIFSDLPEAELAAVFDVLPERARATAEKWNTVACSSYQELLEKVDAVSVCVPSGYHAEVGKTAAIAGKHVLTEKPIDTTLERALSLIETCRKHGVKLNVISQHRHAPEMIKLREMVQGGELGRMLQFDTYVKWYRTQGYYDSADWRGTIALDGGVLMNQAIHSIDMAQWIMGGVEAVQGLTKTLARKIEAEDTAAAIVHFKNGAIGVIQATSLAVPGFSERMEAHGTRGSAIIEADYLKIVEIDEEPDGAGWYGRGLKKRPALVDTTFEPEKHADLWDHMHRAQIQDFCQSILEDRKPLMTGEDALEPLKIILAIYESSRTGGTLVPVKELTRV
jgi:UDP-N-acetyl-2-amino-2-deoxyglucuronate dehydrogenase